MMKHYEDKYKKMQINKAVYQVHELGDLYLKDNSSQTNPQI